MAKSSQRAASQADAAAENIGASAPTGGAAADQHLVVFRIADHRFGFRLDDVGEIIRVPRLAHMPLGPRSLEGLANLRGEVLPVVSLRRLLSVPEAPRDDAARVIVLDGDARVGFAASPMANVQTEIISRSRELNAAFIDKPLTDEALAGFLSGAALRLKNEVK
jgi:purine-binding chemotaxis protein CheW